MIQIRYIRASFDSPAGRVRLVKPDEARALTALGYAVYHKPAPTSPAKPAEQVAADAAEPKRKRVKGRKNVQMDTTETGRAGS